MLFMFTSSSRSFPSISFNRLRLSFLQSSSSLYPSIFPVSLSFNLPRLSFLQSSFLSKISYRIRHSNILMFHHNYVPSQHPWYWNDDKGLCGILLLFASLRFLLRESYYRANWIIFCIVLIMATLMLAGLITW